jgi:hypothetical protein
MVTAGMTPASMDEAFEELRSKVLDGVPPLEVDSPKSLKASFWRRSTAARSASPASGDFKASVSIGDVSCSLRQVLRKVQSCMTRLPWTSDNGQAAPGVWAEIAREVQSAHGIGVWASMHLPRESILFVEKIVRTSISDAIVRLVESGGISADTPTVCGDGETREEASLELDPATQTQVCVWSSPREARQAVVREAIIARFGSLTIAPAVVSMTGAPMVLIVRESILGSGCLDDMATKGPSSNNSRSFGNSNAAEDIIEHDWRHATLGMTIMKVVDAKSADHMSTAVNSFLTKESSRSDVSPILVVISVSHDSVLTADIPGLRVKCDLHNVRIHLEGPGLAMVASSNVSTHTANGMASTHSMSLDPAAWFGIKTCAIITYHHTGSIFATNSTTASEYDSTDFLYDDGSSEQSHLGPFLALWLVLSRLGLRTIKDLLQTANELSNNLFHDVAANSNLDANCGGMGATVRITYAMPPKDQLLRNCMAHEQISRVNTALFAETKDIARDLLITVSHQENQLWLVFSPTRLLISTPELSNTGSALQKFVAKLSASAVKYEVSAVGSNIFAANLDRAIDCQLVHEEEVGPSYLLCYGAFRLVPHELNRSTWQDDQESVALVRILTRRLATQIGAAMHKLIHDDAVFRSNSPTSGTAKSIEPQGTIGAFEKRSPFEFFLCSDNDNGAPDYLTAEVHDGYRCLDAARDASIAATIVSKSVAHVCEEWRQDSGPSLSQPEHYNIASLDTYTHHVVPFRRLANEEEQEHKHQSAQKTFHDHRIDSVSNQDYRLETRENSVHIKIREQKKHVQMRTLPYNETNAKDIRCAEYTDEDYNDVADAEDAEILASSGRIILLDRLYADENSEGTGGHLSTREDPSVFQTTMQESGSPLLEDERVTGEGIAQTWNSIPSAPTPSHHLSRVDPPWQRHEGRVNPVASLHAISPADPLRGAVPAVIPEDSTALARSRWFGASTAAGGGGSGNRSRKHEGTDSRASRRQIPRGHDSDDDDEYRRQNSSSGRRGRGEDGGDDRRRRGRDDRSSSEDSDSDEDSESASDDKETKAGHSTDKNWRNRRRGHHRKKMLEPESDNEETSSGTTSEDDSRDRRRPPRHSVANKSTRPQGDRLLEWFQKKPAAPDKRGCESKTTGRLSHRGRHIHDNSSTSDEEDENSVKHSKMTTRGHLHGIRNKYSGAGSRFQSESSQESSSDSSEDSKPREICSSSKQRDAGFSSSARLPTISLRSASSKRHTYHSDGESGARSRFGFDWLRQGSVPDKTRTERSSVSGSRSDSSESSNGSSDDTGSFSSGPTRMQQPMTPKQRDTRTTKYSPNPVQTRRLPYREAHSRSRRTSKNCDFSGAEHDDDGEDLRSEDDRAYRDVHLTRGDTSRATRTKTRKSKNLSKPPSSPAVAAGSGMLGWFGRESVPADITGRKQARRPSLSSGSSEYESSAVKACYLKKSAERETPAASGSDLAASYFSWFGGTAQASARECGDGRALSEARGPSNSRSRR